MIWIIKKSDQHFIKKFFDQALISLKFTVPQFFLVYSDYVNIGNNLDYKNFLNRVSSIKILWPVLTFLKVPELKLLVSSFGYKNIGDIIKKFESEFH